LLDRLLGMIVFVFFLGPPLFRSPFRIILQFPVGRCRTLGIGTGLLNNQRNKQL
jgi:hypothetical protein